jgi:hypothetical protein
MTNTLLQLVSNGDIHISDFYRIFFEKFGLEFRGEYTIKELIRRVTETKVDIVSVRGYTFPTDIDLLIDEQSSTDFRKKFFGAVMFEDEDSRKNYESIMEVIDKVYVLDELEVKSPVSSSTTGYAFVYIRGIEKDDKPIFGTRTEVMVIKIPY